MSKLKALRDDALAIWHTGLEAVEPGRLIRRALKRRGGLLWIGGHAVRLQAVRSITVVGAGKAGAAMAAAVEQVLGQELMDRKNLRGWVNVPDRTVVPLRRIRLHGARSASENLPTAAGLSGAARIQQLVESAGPHDLVLCLLSGGGSALLPAPVPGVSLAEKLRVTSLLQAAGATIGELNCVRKHLSALKGGGLAARFKGRRLATLIISDVVGDRLDVIASGPTAPDPTTFDQALTVLKKHRLLHDRRTPRSVLAYLRAGAAGQRPETLKRLPRRVTNHIIGNNAVALEAAARTARRCGYRVVCLGSFMEGEARELAAVLAGLVRGVRHQGRPVRPPACVLAGGETTVSLGTSHGTGGRNQELVLALLDRLGPDGMRNVAVLSGGTDGEDGPTDAAGALADATLLQNASRRNMNLAQYLARHDSYHFFEPLGGLIKTGLTDTNVMDLQVILVA